MSITKSLELLDDLAKKHGLSRPFIVGGVPRDQHIDGTHELSDIDITTGDNDVHELAKLFAEEVGKDPIWQKDHYMVNHNDVKYDFAKHIPNPDIAKHLKAKGIEHPTEMEKEVYSRDFTMNTLMMPADQSETFDITGRGIDDIKNRIISCPINCDVSFTYDPRRILRAYYFKVKYDFQFSDDIKKSIEKNKTLLAQINRRYAAEMVNKIIRESPNILDELIDDGVLEFLPITKYVNKLLIENKRLLDVMNRNDARDGLPVIKDNADYNQGLTKKLDEAREDDAIDHNVIQPIELAEFHNSKRNNEYWKQMGDSEAAKEMQEYAKSASLPILGKEAAIRGPRARSCPFGLPISVACRNAGNSVDNMSDIAGLDKARAAKQIKANRRVYVYNQTGERCVYADKIVEGEDKVHCDWGDGGARLNDYPLRPSPFYPRVFHGLGQYGLYSYPLNDYAGAQGARDIFSGMYSLYASDGQVETSKTKLPVLDDDDEELE